MNFEQAQHILRAHPSRQEADPDSNPELAQAKARLQSDPELARWYQKEKARDEQVRTALRSISPPAGLRDRILAAEKTHPFPKIARLWLAAAACVLLGAGALIVFPRSAGEQLAPGSLEAQIPRLNAAHQHELAVKAADLAAIRHWLATHGGIANFQIPAGLAGLAGIACEVSTINGTKVTVLCFHLEDRKVAHLYVVDRSDLQNPPGPGEPQIEQIGDTAIASWSQDELSYFLSGSGDIGFVQSLL